MSSNGHVSSPVRFERYYYLARNAIGEDDFSPALAEALTAEELRMFEAMLYLREGQVLIAFDHMRALQRDGYPQARLLARAALFFTRPSQDGAEIALLEAIRADRAALVPILTSEEIDNLYNTFLAISGNRTVPGASSRPAARFTSVFPHERATDYLLESPEYVAGIEQFPTETINIAAPGEPIDLDVLFVMDRRPYLIDDAVLTEILDRVRTRRPVSQQSIAIALSAYSDPSRRDVATLNLLLDELGSIDGLLDFQPVNVRFSVDTELSVARSYLLRAVIRASYYAGRYETTLAAFARLLQYDDSAEGQPPWFVDSFLYAAAAAAGLPDLERAYALLDAHLRYATIYQLPRITADISDFANDEEWLSELRADTSSIDRAIRGSRNRVDLRRALAWYYFLAPEFQALAGTSFDRQVEDLFASRLALSESDIIAHDGRSGPLPSLIEAYERVAAEQE